MRPINHLFSKKDSLLYPLILALLCLVLIVLNHTPNTILSGWDTLHPEFNFSLNFQRLIFGVFREEQGLGAVAAHAHMADLPRVFLLWVFSPVFPMEFLRFLVISLCLPVGVLGVFYFLKDIIFDKKGFGKHFAFLGSLFYLFNLGTLQHFYVPFEMFTVGYAAIPWLFWSVSRYLADGSRKNVMLFCLITLFAAPMAYAPMLWYAYFGSLCLFLFIFIKKNFPGVKTIIALTLLINSFWILPNLYFIFSGNAALVPDSKINKIFSEEAYSLNQSFGNISDVLIFKNFLFDWPVYEGQNQFGFLLDIWRNYTANYLIAFLGFLFAEIFLIGFILSFRSRNNYLKALIGPFIFCLIFLVNSTWPVSGLFELLRNNSSLFKEAVRFPFTKFSLVLMFASSVFFSYSLYSLVGLLKQSFKRYNRFFILITVGLFAILFSVYMYPFFQGELISKRMQLKIPSEYFEVFDYLNQRSYEGRVAVFPVHTFWGWIYYNFGFQGAQFISFGIKQSLMDRDYDRWNPKNEQYYQEMSYAVYTKNLEALENVLKKYQIKYLMIDENIISPGPSQDQKVLYIPEVKALLEQLENDKKLSLTKHTENLTIYEYNSNFNSAEGLSYVTSVNYYDGSYELDLPYSSAGNYKKANTPYDVRFPFWPFQDNQNIVNSNLLNINEGKIFLNSGGLKKLDFKDYGMLEDVIPAKFYAKKESSGISLKIDISLGGKQNESLYVVPIDFNFNEKIIINIDETQTIELRNLGEEFTFQGQVLLPTKGLTNLAFYKKANSKKVMFNGSIIRNEPGFDYQNSITEDFLLKLCSASDKDQVFAYDASDVKNIKIASKNSQSCLWIPLEKILEQNNIGEFKDLLSYSFIAQTRPNIFGRVCIYDKSANRCLKEKKYITNLEQFEDYFPINNEDIGKLELVLYLDGINNQKLEDFNYQNFEIAVNRAAVFLTLDSDEILSKVADQEIEQSDKGEFLINFGENWDNLSLNFLEPYHKVDNCGKNTTEIFERNVNVTEKYLEFKTLSGSNCDYFSLPLALHNIGYLVEIETQNIKGLPLRMCIANNFSKRCEVYLSLPKSLYPTKYLIAVPPTKDGGVGMDIHFDNYSVGNSESINRITNLKVYPFPYKFISSYRIGNPILSGNGQQDLAISSAKIFPFLYKVSSEGKEIPRYITLNQSFENGWVLLGGASHHEYNGWANIFETNNSINKTLWILYLPELLELLGLLILTSIVLNVLVYPYFPRAVLKL